MKRKRSLPSKVPVTEADARAIDALYGLEPIFEPSTVNNDAGAPTRFESLNCPYCGESYVTCIDLSNANCAYIEDCQVCCQPMELTIELDEAGAFQSLVARRLD